MPEHSALRPTRLDPSWLRQDAFALERKAAEDILARGHTLATIVELAADAEQTFTRVAAELTSGWKPACKSGCAWCCHIEVVTTVPEVLRIADYLGAKVPPKQASLLRKQIASNRQKAAGLNSEARGRAHIPCGLLIDNRCSVYPVRPLACRGWSSSDVRLCRQSYSRPLEVRVPIHLWQRELLAGVTAGLRVALESAGLYAEGGAVELNAALDIALTTSRAAERWLAGENVFAPAVPLPTDLELRLGLGRAQRSKNELT